jgi:hypothetical protein
MIETATIALCAIFFMVPVLVIGIVALAAAHNFIGLDEETK